MGAKESVNCIEDGLVAMANDPEIQRQLKQIEEEFACPEADGLEMENDLCP
jgi:hypothetical protein